jgi:hypothetical protein
MPEPDWDTNPNPPLLNVREVDSLEEIDPALIGALSHLFDEYGPAGTINVAQRMYRNLEAASKKLQVSDFQLPPTDV